MYGHVWFDCSFVMPLFSLFQVQRDQVWSYLIIFSINLLSFGELRLGKNLIKSQETAEMNLSHWRFRPIHGNIHQNILACRDNSWANNCKIIACQISGQLRYALIILLVTVINKLLLHCCTRMILINVTVAEPDLRIGRAEWALDKILSEPIFSWYCVLFTAEKFTAERLDAYTSKD